MTTLRTDQKIGLAFIVTSILTAVIGSIIQRPKKKVVFGSGEVDGILATLLDMCGASYTYAPEGSTVEFTPAQEREFRYDAQRVLGLVPGAPPDLEFDEDDYRQLRYALDLLDTQNPPRPKGEN